MADPQLPSRFIEAIRTYVKTRDRNRPVSVARLASAARSLMPGVAIADGELVDLIARELVMAGANVDFDSRRTDSSAPPAFRSAVAIPAEPLITRGAMPLSIRHRRVRKGRGTQL